MSRKIIEMLTAFNWVMPILGLLDASLRDTVGRFMDVVGPLLLQHNANIG